MSPTVQLLHCLTVSLLHCLARSVPHRRTFAEQRVRRTQKEWLALALLLLLIPPEHPPQHSTTHPRSCTRRIRINIMAGSQQDETMLLNSLTADAPTAPTAPTAPAPEAEIAVAAASESSESEERASKRRRFSPDSPAVQSEEELCIIEPVTIAAAAGLSTSDVSMAAVEQSSTDCDESKQSSETDSAAASLDQVPPDSAASPPFAAGSAAAKPASKRRAQCKICGLVLSSGSNRLRHERSKHKLTTTSSPPQQQQQQQQQQRHSNPAAFIDAQPRRSDLHGAAGAARGAATSSPSPGPQTYRSASKRSFVDMTNTSSPPMIPLARSQSLSEAEEEEWDSELADFIAAGSAGSDLSACLSAEDSEERPLSASTSSGDDTKSDDGPPHDAQQSSSTSSESDSNDGLGMNFPGNPLLYSDEEMQAGCQSFLVWLRYVSRTQHFATPARQTARGAVPCSESSRFVPDPHALAFASMHRERTFLLTSFFSVSLSQRTPSHPVRISGQGAVSPEIAVATDSDQEFTALHLPAARSQGRDEACLGRSAGVGEPGHLPGAVCCAGRAKSGKRTFSRYLPSH